MGRFEPRYHITPKTAGDLMRIEASRQAVAVLPLPVAARRRLRETARLASAHYSTEIEGNRLTLEQAGRVVLGQEHFPGRQRDEQEVMGYFVALDEIERWAAKRRPVSEALFKELHGLVLGGGARRARPTEYRDGQNVIRESGSKRIVYLPPEAGDVPVLMGELIAWINASLAEGVPVPLVAGVAHYQIATIHPYYDGNGRTARLLATYVMHLGGYDLKGFYALEEHYSRDLGAYYQAICVGPSHNYYLGRAEADITAWVGYFVDGVAEAFENVLRKAKEAEQGGAADKSPLLRLLDVRQRQAVALFLDRDWITAADVAGLFHIRPRTASELCRKWSSDGFLALRSAARRTRSYALAETFKGLLDG